MRINQHWHHIFASVPYIQMNYQQKMCSSVLCCSWNVCYHGNTVYMLALSCPLYPYGYPGGRGKDECSVGYLEVSTIPIWKHVFVALVVPFL